ncbi:hypothetical protein ACFQ3S_00505 [Mucilaginibacter terrae]|uniref:hypothetical protein n=1 Tax=Mucilaginibacter terrae TaxID=1955052 RepID=UPI003624ECFC
MNQSTTYKQPWLHSLATDSVFILLPPFLALLLVVAFPVVFQSSSAIPVMYWLILVVFIDVAHVYSTLYRTYFNYSSYRQNSLLIVIPMACYVVGVLLHSVDAILFWRILAYLAVFHFIRQQYGFMRLYSRKETYHKFYMLIDTIAIYTATIYPIFYWHFEGNRHFNWFTDNDFIMVSTSTTLINVGLIIYLVVISVYIIKEILLIKKIRQFNIPRNLLVIGTFVSWYFGIVYFNGDFAFTMLNVISHGIPYMALIWIAEKKKYPGKSDSFMLNASFSKYGIILFVITLIVFAYLEEGIWDGLIWREHASIFGAFTKLPKIQNTQLLSLLVPLLALPQATHYVLDGYIWKVQKQELS